MEKQEWESVPRKLVVARESGSTEICQKLFSYCICEDMMALA